ncbi:MAG TPA: hypothetical protein PLD17_03180 [Flavobacteriales bacterium]|nr:hypothetical protein [Flavobacteriales bacterium]
MNSPAARRKLIIVLIAVIMICCTASAVFGFRSGHTARAVSTFFAGLAFSFMIWSQMARKQG